MLEGETWVRRERVVQNLQTGSPSSMVTGLIMCPSRTKREYKWLNPSFLAECIGFISPVQLTSLARPGVSR